MTPELKEYVKAWLQKAANDILSAQRLLEIEPMILDSACFHCQQAIEKSLKALLCYYGKAIIRTHDIDFLLDECSQLDPVFGTVDTLNVNDFAVNVRYPDFTLLPDIQEARKIFELAVFVNGMVMERIVFEE